jgi:hypothetical protein
VAVVAAVPVVDAAVPVDRVVRGRAVLVALVVLVDQAVPEPLAPAGLVRHLP